MNGKNHYMAKLFLMALVFGLFSLFGVAGLLFTISTQLPDVNDLKTYTPSIPSRIYSRGGVVLRELGREKRQLVRVDEIPPLIVDSFLAAEDANFYSHSGIDYLGILRALIADIKAGKIVQGGVNYYSASGQIIATYKRKIDY
jgi:penicillin-binding protein 1A